MATLSSILQLKSANTETFAQTLTADNFFEVSETKETNMLPGDVSVYTNTLCNQGRTINWQAPSAGTVVIEVWGASGSGSRMCCCGSSVPGNPGAYAKKTITVAAGNTITGVVGDSCGNASTLGYRGRSESSGVCWITADGNGCICAEGGFGGRSFCNAGTTSIACCALTLGYCGTIVSTGCGIICNFAGPDNIVSAQAYGGDKNCSGGISLACFFACSSASTGSFRFIPAISPGIFSTDTSYMNVQECAGNTVSNCYETGPTYILAVGSLGRVLGNNARLYEAANSAKWCGCYEQTGCEYFLPPGVPGSGGQPCASVRDSGLRGGSGAVRIRFIGT